MHEVNILQRILDQEYGHRRSKNQRKSIDANNMPVPWMTYAAIFYIEQLDLKEKNLFEWGGGSSSIYFSDRAKTVTIIESKKEWYDYVLENKKENMNVILADDTNYASVIKEQGGGYDVIVIDGEIYKRYECATYAVDCLNSGGMIILDNSDWLSNTCEFLRGRGFIQVDMSGFGPINDYTWCTSFFLTHDFNFTPKSGASQPCYVPGGLTNVRD
jgi:hypothetical protein